MLVPLGFCIEKKIEKHLSDKKLKLKRIRKVLTRISLGTIFSLPYSSHLLMISSSTFWFFRRLAMSLKVFLIIPRNIQGLRLKTSFLKCSVKIICFLAHLKVGVKHRGSLVGNPGGGVLGVLAEFF